MYLRIINKIKKSNQMLTEEIIGVKVGREANII